MRLKLQKRRALKFVSRIILQGQGIIHRSLLRNMFPKLALGFIPLISKGLLRAAKGEQLLKFI